MCLVKKNYKTIYMASKKIKNITLQQAGPWKRVS